MIIIFIVAVYIGFSIATNTVASVVIGIAVVKFLCCTISCELLGRLAAASHTAAIDVRLRTFEWIFLNE